MLTRIIRWVAVDRANGRAAAGLDWVGRTRFVWGSFLVFHAARNLRLPKYVPGAFLRVTTNATERRPSPVRSGLGREQPCV